MVEARCEVNRYMFRVLRGRNRKECLGIKRLGRRGGEEVLVLVGTGRKRISFL